MKYKCAKSFNISTFYPSLNYSNEGFHVKEGCIWCLEENEHTNSNSNVIIRLTNELNEWIEIHQKDLKGHFEKN